jgi:hypothetical protein
MVQVIGFRKTVRECSSNKFLEVAMIYSQEGTLKAEDTRFRNIARSQVRTALAQQETKVNNIVDHLVKQINAKVVSLYSTDQLLETVVNNRTLQQENITINKYTSAFPELSDDVSSKQERIFRHARKRIKEAVAPFEYQKRFAYTTGLHH